ncbi:MAG: transport protein TqsA [Methanoculleus sp.]|nr:transport protein TqsA [Methanoculleus sp.]MDK2990087.1 transport protein TqsA [Methanoculleus sp.]
MPAPSRLASLTRVVIVAAVVVTGMHLGAAVVSPVLVGFILAVVVTPTVHRLEERGLPRMAGVLAMVGVIAGVALLLVALLSLSLVELDSALPAYQDLLRAQLQGLQSWFADLGIPVSVQPPEPPNGSMFIPPLWEILAELSVLAIDFLVILIVTVFMLLEVASFRGKLVQSLGSDAMAELDRSASGLVAYVSLRTKSGLATGIAVAILLSLLGIDAPALWAVLIVVLGYIPYFGLPIASVPPIGLAWLQHGLPGALAVAVGIFIVDVLARRFLLPYPAERALRISPLAIILSVLAWTLVLGVPGLFLAAPLTLLVKAVLSSSEETQWMAILMEQSGDARSPGKPSTDR